MARTHLNLPPVLLVVAMPAATLSNTTGRESRSLQTHRLRHFAAPNHARPPWNRVVPTTAADAVEEQPCTRRPVKRTSRSWRAQQILVASRPVSLTLPIARPSQGQTARTSSVAPKNIIAGRDATRPTQTTLLPSPASLPQTNTFPTTAALAFHGITNVASYLPSVSRDARYAYHTRISRKPSSPCPHRPQIRLADSPMHAPQHPNAPTAKTAPHAQRYPQTLSTPLPSLAPQPRRRKPAQLLLGLLLLHRQTNSARRRHAVGNNVWYLLGFAPSPAHSAPLQCFTVGHWESL